MSMSRNLVKEFIKTLERNPNKKILGDKKNHKWSKIDRNDLYNKISQGIHILKDNNIKKGDRVAYKGKNSVDWVAWNMSCYAVGATWVPMYHNQNVDYCKYIIKDCKPKILLSNPEHNLDHLDIRKVSNIIEETTNVKDIDLIDNELATLIYTSGTTGNPKGVKLMHENIFSNIEGINKRFSDIEPTHSLNVLPWAHIYSLTCELYYNLIYDNCTYISSSKENFIKECSEVNPEVLYVVPKILELVKNKTDFMDKPILRLILAKLINDVFGSNLQNIFIGGAKLDDTTKDYFIRNKINICEGYGCTETSPMISVNHLTEPKNIDSIGKILDGVSVKIINDEICVNGPNVMNGYWNNKEATEKSIIESDGKMWYKTGDSGYVKDDFLFYNGRISENYKLNNGKFVNVLDVESIIKKHLDSNFIVFGENKNHNRLISDKDITKATLKNINNDLDGYLEIKNTIIVSEDKMKEFLTPKLSIKRKPLIEYAENLLQK